jgi:hypothetical protein
MEDNLTSGSARSNQEPATNVIERKRPERLTKTMANTSRYLRTIKKRILPQNTVFSAEQSAIIGEIQSERNNRHEIVIKTDSLSTIMAVESRKPTNNPKAQTIRKMLDNEGPRMTLLWVPRQSGMPGKANQAAKEALEGHISTTERCPPDDLNKWLTETEMVDQCWKNTNNGMKERKPDVDRKEDRKEMPSKEQVAISGLRTGLKQPTMLLKQHPSFCRPHTVGMQRN